MPTGKKYSISQIVKACDYYLAKTKRRVSYEYIVIHGVNDLKEDSDKLADLFKGKNVHINLIPLNPIDEFNYKKTQKTYIKDFAQRLEKKGINVTVRNSMGQDIDASCGQLRNNYAR